MGYQVTNVMTGLVNKPVSPSMAVTNAVNKATSTPTDAGRLGNVTQMNVQPTVNNAPSQKLANTVGTMTEQFQSAPAPAQAPAPTPTQAPAPAPQEQSILQKTLDSIMGVSTQLESKGARTLEIQQEEGIFEKQAKSKQIENEMMAKSRAYDKQIEEARKNPEGKLIGGLQAQLGDIERQKNSELADLAIQYKVANDDYAGAWQVAQAKIDAEFAPLVARLDTLKSYYQLAQNDMTESEKLQAQTKIREQESALEFERTKQLKTYEQQIRQSDPMYQAQLRTEQAQTANIYDQIRSRNQNDLASGEGTLNGKPQTQAQAKVHGFADRLAQANRTISEIGSNFTSFLSFGGSLSNRLQTSDRQAYEQAKRNFVNAILRQESGAVIADSEFASAEKQYFPVAGDNEKVILQKAENRNTAINNLYREANTQRPAIAGDIIEDENGKQYRVGIDGVTLEKL
jgi:hypothetical protein